MCANDIMQPFIRGKDGSYTHNSLHKTCVKYLESDVIL